MKRVAQEARIRQGVVKYTEKHGKSEAARKYGVSLSSVKRWSRRYDGTWQSLQQRSHRSQSHPRQHTEAEEAAIRQAFGKAYMQYGWDGVYEELLKNHGYTRSFGGMSHAATRMGLGWGKKRKRASRAVRRYPALMFQAKRYRLM